MLKCVKKTVIEVDAFALERHITAAYGLQQTNKYRKPYSFVEVQECGNDSYHSFDVDGKLDKAYAPDLEEVRAALRGEKGFPMYQNDLILNVACADGHLEPGEYLVNVCW